MGLDDNEIRGGFNFTLAIGIAFLLLLALGTIGYYTIYPYLLERQTEANRSSYQYVSTTQQLLQENMRDYLELDVKIQEYSKDSANQSIVDGMKAQQKAILNEMRAKAGTIKAEQVPAEVAQFLSVH